jgi:hypothetical protein
LGVFPVEDRRGSGDGEGWHLKWVLVASANNRSIRGWVLAYDPNVPGWVDAVQEPPPVDWSAIPRVRPDVLAPRGGMPDLAVEVRAKIYHEGETCETGTYEDTWAVSVVNRGTGAGPARLVIEERAESGKTRSRALRYNRRIFPGEVIYYDFFRTATHDLSIIADPDNAVRESHEGNNRGLLPLSTGNRYVCR